MSRDPLLIAHRGMPGRFQNSRRGVQRALDAGYRGLEIDIVLTADGVLMLSHDPWLHDELVTDRQGQALGSRQLIKDLRWPEIEANFLVGGAPTEDEPEPAEAPTRLDEVLEILAEHPEVLLYLDVKIEDPEAELTHPVEAYAEHMFARLREAGLTNPIWVEAPTAAMAEVYRRHRGELNAKFALSFPRFEAGQTRMEIARETVEAMADDPVDLSLAAGVEGFAAPWMVVQTWEALRAAREGLTGIFYAIDNARKLEIRDDWPQTMLIVDHWEGIHDDAEKPAWRTLLS